MRNTLLDSFSGVMSTLEKRKRCPQPFEVGVKRVPFKMTVRMGKGELDGSAQIWVRVGESDNWSKKFQPGKK